MDIDLSLKNTELYHGCMIEEIAGRLNLVTPPAEAMNIIGRNIIAMVNAVPREERDEATLTGPMAVWSYLVVFHNVLHSFRRIYYDDGKVKLLVAAHG